MNMQQKPEPPETALNQTLHFTLATAGHVDHGKTSVLRALTGIDPDRLKEEKEREMTIDLGFAHFDTQEAELERLDSVLASRLKAVAPQAKEVVVGFVDVPGHGKFLKNMLAGVGGIDMALLVVAADEGVMPQTIQHVKILALLGVRECILVINKIDLAEPDQEELSTAETEELLNRFGITVLETVRFSSTTGAMTEELKKTILMHVLSMPVRDRRHDAVGKRLSSFLAIDRVFTKAGYGAVVTGTLTRGTIKVGDEVFVEPGALNGRVRGLQTFNHKLEQAYPGQRLAINLALKENKPIERGQAVLGEQVAAVTNLIVQISDLGGLEASQEVSGEGLKPQNVRFYHGTAERYGFLRWIQEIDVAEEKQSGERANLRQAVIGQLVLEQPVIAGPGEKFIIRYGDFGIAGGEIFLTARPRWLSRAMLKVLAEKIWHGDLQGATLELINQSPQRSLANGMINSLLPDHERRKVVSMLAESGMVEKVGEQFITKDEKNNLVKRVLDALKKAADSGERDKSVSQEKLKVKIAPLVDRTVFQNIIRELVASNQIVKIEERLALPVVISESAATGGTATPVMEKILEVLAQNFCIEIAELSKQIRFSEQDVMDGLTKLEKQGKAAVVNYEFASNSTSITEAHKALANIWQKQKSISPGDFREQIGVSRKYAMALLAYFDDHQITRRLPSGRVLLKMPPN